MELSDALDDWPDPNKGGGGGGWPVPNQPTAPGPWPGVPPQQPSGAGQWPGVPPQQPSGVGPWPGPSPQQPSGVGPWPGPPPQQPSAAGSWPGPPPQQPSRPGQWPGPPPAQPSAPSQPSGPGQWPSPAQPSAPSQPSGPGHWPSPGRSTAPCPQPDKSGSYKLEFPHGLHNNNVITIAGTVKPNAKRFTLDFSTGLDLAFHFNPRFDEDGRQVIVRNSCVRQKWGCEERNLGPFPFGRGRSFVIKIRPNDREYKVDVDGRDLLSFKHRVSNLSSIRHLSVHYDVTLSELSLT